MSDDYYNKYLYDNMGCCLRCDKAEPGCMCRECKCSLCEHHQKGEWLGDGIKEKGLCLLAESFKEDHARMKIYKKACKFLHWDVNKSYYVLNDALRNGEIYKINEYISEGSLMKFVRRNPEIDKKMRLKNG